MMPDPSANDTPARGTKPKTDRARRKGVKATSTGGDARAVTNVRRELVETTILEHATRLFAERGFAGTRFQDVADATGLTRPALYYYFSNKDQLLERLIAEDLQTSAAELQVIAQRDDLDPAMKLTDMARSMALRSTAHAERLRLLLRSESDLPEPILSSYKAGRRAVLKELTSVIDDGMVSGHFRPVIATMAAFGVIGMCNWVAWWYHPGRWEPSAIADNLADMALASVARYSRTQRRDGPAAVIGTLREELSHLERMLGDATEE